MEIFIGDISKPIRTLFISSIGKDANELFEMNKNLEGIVTIDKDFKPQGLITRTQFYQKLGTRYGYDLYMQRPINLLMDEQPLIVDNFKSILEVSNLAMSRKQEKLYDYIIVTRDDIYSGVVSIKDLLLKITEIQVSIARFENPLTGLPGNIVIKEKLTEILKSEEFSVLYFDLDNFKAFNDVYGFKDGDEVIRNTAHLITSAIQKIGNGNAFAGHIGGDDFISILKCHEVDSICMDIIEQFHAIINIFYKEEHLKSGYIISKNRKGTKQKFPLLSLSIAVVTNKSKEFYSVDEIIKEAVTTKEKCKSIIGSCYCIDGIF
ncbi:GGDEF domain-containing protein [Serpentinicella alkaliphila]|uniref:Diguanylate cyclase (GGDEF)-like protein n=1 Tax=Serpentinicella alkaliphila TaxID=1734049 RepID=A0A4R2TPJ4_9FIRM|nr:GGDEF domain-containing protein [Serpentinicella alkaliphila]QUH24543.1 GGDEF domain-containing protein [Serpentinicella alkaliphila]TCQ04637.1 diguanylate cyclase (GGDEF)-like protein [Serpentinicella alkaliphila]